MNVLLLSIGNLVDVRQHEIYTDLLREFRDNGHNVYAISTYEKRLNCETTYNDEFGIKMLRVKIGNITKCSILEKGISTVTLGRKFKKAIKEYLHDVIFDLVLYSTPPITFCGVVSYLKRRNNAYTYLMLKDIFPQNAIDIGILSKTGMKSLLYYYFKYKERKLYLISDTIGCMSQANIDYLIKQNPWINQNKVKLCPNCIEVQDFVLNKHEISVMREKYGIPLEKRIYIYGGNLGMPQGIDFIIECLKTQTNNNNDFFLIIGDGSEYNRLRSAIDELKCQNIRLLKTLPKDDYDKLVAACDVGLLFLDYRFTIPNYPSRVLAYMQAGLPVFACTDENSDIGEMIINGKFGWWCPSNSVTKFVETINIIDHCNLSEMKNNSLNVLKNQFDVSIAYRLIISSLNR